MKRKSSPPRKVASKPKSTRYPALEQITDVYEECGFLYMEGKLKPVFKINQAVKQHGR